MNNWEKKYRERVIAQKLLREPKDFEEQADIAEDKWIILTELLEEQQDTINELKNTVERQEILIEKMRWCKICTHYQSCLDNDLLYGEAMGRHNGCIDKSKWELEEDIDG